MSAAIEIHDLVKLFRGKPAVNRLTLSVPTGSVCALLGDNGAGKTTTIRMLTGLLQPDAGTATILGEDCWRAAHRLRHRVGYVPERPRFYEWMSVSEVGWFTSGFHPSGFLTRYKDLIRRFQLDPKGKMRHLSKGQYAKVALALALAPDPEVLILDEPTSGLDLLVRREFLASLIDLAGEGRTVLISSHQIAEVERIASHVAFVSHGRLLLAATAEELRQRVVRLRLRYDARPPEADGLGTVLQRNGSGRQWQAVVLDPEPEAVAALRETAGVCDFEEVPLGLEDVYCALLESSVAGQSGGKTVMTYTLVWKEYREQRAIWLAVALMALLVLAGLKAALQPAELTDITGLAMPGCAVVLLCLAGVYGLACGGSMFAGEIENRTLPFLDTLPATRSDLWGNKVISGLLLSLTQGWLLAGAGYAVGLDMEGLEHLLWVLPLTAVEAFAWGLVGSAVVRSALPAAALGAVPLALSWLMGGAMFWPPPVLGVAPRVGLLLFALLLSRRLFCAPDRSRGPISRTASRRMPHPETQDGAPTPITALVWLTLRQAWGEALVLGGLAFLEGLFLQTGGYTLWLLATLVVGILCGTGAFRDEQTGESARFVGEQRLPPGLFWCVKLGLWLTLSIALTLGMLLSGVLVAASQGPSGLNDLGLALLMQTGHAPLLLVLGLVYGFTVGQLTALVSRKPPVSVVLAVLLAVPAAVVWLPSSFMGGLPVWQALFPAGLLLSAGYLVRRAWVAERLGSLRSALTLFGALALALVAILGALAWRVFEVPGGAPPIDVVAFELSLPTPEKNPAGALIRRATQGLRDRLVEIAPQAPPGADGGMGLPPMGGMGGPPGMFGPLGMGDVPGEAMLGPPPPRDFAEEATMVAARGWEKGTPELGRWLDRLFEGEWARAMLELPELPLGVVENPRYLKVSSTIPTTQECMPLARYLTARALQLQATGKDREGLQHLASVLALSRNLRNKAVPLSCLIGLGVERTALVGLQHWLERVDRKPELLREALELLARHESELPPRTDPIMAEYLFLRNSVLDPNELARLTTLPGRGADSAAGRWVAAASQAPWERQRMERLLNAVFTIRLQAAEVNYREAESLRQRWPTCTPEETLILDWIPGEDTPGAEANRRRLGRLLAESWLVRILPATTDQLRVAQTLGLAWVRGCRLVVALALYQLEQGKPAAALDELIPKYLPTPLTDPFNDWPFHYRVSQGERMAWHAGDVAPGQEHRTVPPGQGIVWSVGLDGTDHGARRQGAEQHPQTHLWQIQDLDLIFLVPRPQPRP